MDERYQQTADYLWGLAQSLAERDGRCEAIAFFIPPDPKQKPESFDIQQTINAGMPINVLFIALSAMAQDVKAIAYVLICHAELFKRIEEMEDLDEEDLVQVLSFAWGNSFIRYSRFKSVGDIRIYNGMSDFEANDVFQAIPWGE